MLRCFLIVFPLATSLIVAVYPSMALRVNRQHIPLISISNEYLLSDCLTVIYPQNFQSLRRVGIVDIAQICCVLCLVAEFVCHTELVQHEIRVVLCISFDSYVCMHVDTAIFISIQGVIAVCSEERFIDPVRIVHRVLMP